MPYLALSYQLFAISQKFKRLLSTAAATGLGFRLRLTAVTAEASRRRELAQPMADHVFRHKNFQMCLAVMNHKGVADEFGNDHAGSRPRGNRFLHARLVLPIHLGKQLRVDVRTFF